jgi:hypothetical protein
MARITLDLARLTRDGALSAAEAERLASLAEPAGAPFWRAGGVLVNVLMILGVAGVVSATLLLEPPPEVGLGIAVAAVAAGWALRRYRAREWSVLATALILAGVLGVDGYLVWRLEGAEAAHWATFAITGAAALVFRSALLAALLPLIAGSLIGSGTGYWHAGYSLYVREATITALVFSAVAAALFYARPKIAAAWEPLATMAARVSFFLANFGFWVGSLWGDYVGEMWAAGENRWEAVPSWREAAVHVPAGAFSIAWAAFLVACIAVGAHTGRRFLANTAVVFLAIHAYTQFFETFGAAPIPLLIGGLGLVALAAGLGRFDAWVKARTKPA